MGLLIYSLIDFYNKSFVRVPLLFQFYLKTVFVLKAKFVTEKKYANNKYKFS